MGAEDRLRALELKTERLRLSLAMKEVQKLLRKNTPEADRESAAILREALEVFGD